jgi:preprotein translocase subunit SecA
MIRRAVYNTGILYATNNELGFDYCVTIWFDEIMFSELAYAIVDEVDLF